MPHREEHNGVLEQTSCEASMACPPECGMKTAKGARNPRSAVGRRRKREGKTCVVRPGSAMPVTGSGTPREEGAIWRMTRCGRRSLSEGARVVRVARERDDICVNRRRPVCRLARCREGSLKRSRADRLPRSHLRVAIEDVAVRATGRLPADTDAPRAHWAHAPRERRIRLERPDRNASATRASSQGIRSSGKPQGRERNHPGRQVALNRRRAGRRDAGWKRRSGIVRRLAAPDSASAASERCRGPQTSREAPDRMTGADTLLSRHTTVPACRSERRSGRSCETMNGSRS